MSKRILIIEDEPYLAEMYRLKFEHEGYKISLADNGDDGLAMAGKELPDLILLDLIIPGLSGHEVLKGLKSHELTKRIPVIVLSNLNQDDEIKKCMDGGAVGFLVKANLTPGQISEHVNKYFTKETGANTPVKPRPDDDLRHEKKNPRGIKALIIEDQEDIVEMYKMRLEKDGFTVEVARNGVWGLKLVQEKEYNVIIMDIMMPAMNGLKMLEHLRNDSKNKEAPIIVLSNSAQDGDIDIAKKHGASAYLLKSKITPARLVEEVEKLL